MNKRSIIYIIIFFLIIFIFLYFKYLKKEKVIKIESKDSEEFVYNSNIIENVSYSSKDLEGNQYTIKATNGEIDFKQNDIIFLRNVKAKIEFKNTKLVGNLFGLW
jgi:regulatory protein YycI of two-component signal transduction system YycFG